MNEHDAQMWDDYDFYMSTGDPNYFPQAEEYENETYDEAYDEVTYEEENSEETYEDPYEEAHQEDAYEEGYEEGKIDEEEAAEELEYYTSTTPQKEAEQPASPTKSNTPTPPAPKPGFWAAMHYSLKQFLGIGAKKGPR